MHSSDLLNSDFSSGIRVNGELISEREIYEEMQYHPKDSQPWKKAADALVIRSLLLQEAKRLKVEAKPLKLGEGCTEVEDEALIRSLVETKVQVDEVDEQECLNFYGLNLTKFRSPFLYEARHILYQAAPGDFSQIKTAEQKAIACIEMLQQSPWKFEQIARTESSCTSARQGGYLGQFGPGQMDPAFELALQELKEGEIGKSPAQTRYGFHVVQMVRRESGKQLPFEAVRERIAEYLKSRKWRYAVRVFIQNLIDKSTIIGWQPSGHLDLN